MPLLRAEGITVRFGGVTALEDVEIDADAGEITGLIGPNGAGKTTCFNVLTGLQPQDLGRVEFAGDDVTGVPAFKRSRLGIARTFQRLEVFGSLSVFENVLVGAEIRARWGESDGDPRDEATHLVELVGLKHMSDERVDAIPTGHARLTELARALATRPKLLLLDEPSSGLDDTESEVFGDLIIKLAEAGLGIVIVEHDVDLVMKCCTRIHVLDFGRKIADGTPKQIQDHPRVQEAYLGVVPDEPEWLAETSKTYVEGGPAGAGKKKAKAKKT